MMFPLADEVLALVLLQPPSAKHEYREQYLKSCCRDVVDDVITIKIISFDIICYAVFISEVKFKLSLNLGRFQYGRQICTLANLETESETET